MLSRKGTGMPRKVNEAVYHVMVGRLLGACEDMCKQGGLLDVDTLAEILITFQASLVAACLSTNKASQLEVDTFVRGYTRDIDSTIRRMVRRSRELPVEEREKEDQHGGEEAQF